jgi:allantoin racemase
MKLCFLGTPKRLAYVRAFASPGTTVEGLDGFVGQFQSPSSIESRWEELALAQAVVEQAIEAEKRGFDAVITACLGDPGVDAAREMVRIPVIAPGETALLTARMISHHFSVITPLEETVPLAREQVHKSGLAGHVASIRPFNMDVERIRDREPATFTKLVDLARSCVEDDGAEAIVLSCASLSVLVDEVKDQISVPIIDAVRLSLRAAEMLVGSGLTHSPRTFPTPAKLAAKAGPRC